MKLNRIINMGNMRNLLTAIIFLILSPSILLAGTENKLLIREYSVEGVAIVEEGDTNKGRGDAMEDAFKNAVRLSTNVMLKREPSANERREIEEQIVTGSKRYVEGYRMAHETFGKGYYSVTMAISLYQGLLNKDLSDMGLKPDSSASPLVVVLIEEKILPTYNRDNFMSLFSVSEEGIVTDLAKETWNVMGRRGIANLASQRKIDNAIDGDVRSLVSLGEDVAAAIVVSGSASIDPSTNGRSRLSLLVVSVSSRKVLGESVFTGYSNSKDPLLAKTGALKDASAKGERYISEILNREIGLSTGESRQPIAVPIQGR
ncbi:MAG: hypothetical protein ABIJ24_05595 [Nitrospinota bacterium]|nr:hypothetical protein [Nitrospinota bacterium]